MTRQGKHYLTGRFERLVRARTRPAGGAAPREIEVEEIVLHGHRIAFRHIGTGPLTVLLHGIATNSETWRLVMARLAEHYTVIAPDLLGHGQSAKPRGDYSVGAYASGIRDILLALGYDRATFVGHSLGGGVALQLAYQFPELCERLVLVDSGGLGREVSLLMRSATLAGAKLTLSLLCRSRVLSALEAVAESLDRHGVHLTTDTREILRGHGSLEDAEAREAFLHTLRALVEPRGQRVTATDRLYLAENLPVLIIWGRHDRIIPLSHGRSAHRQVRGSRLEVFERSGHFPHLDEPDGFTDVLLEFMRTTEPARLDTAQVRSILEQAEANRTVPQRPEPDRSTSERV